MLTAETKRKIDNARQVLVGKVPNPAAQIDQITNALIYKFMDDMDEKSRTMGGEATFFVGELEPYAWSKLMSPALGAQEKLNKYSEALEKFSNSENLPKLFRDIFRQAHLPYRDPQTLNLFLKEIDYFDYNHSEELGNAFEYLLSIMGSQGDAGMFRTPRHIIDFIVDVVNPTKDDTILDPACGTAGFLISAYKHIMRNHDGVDNVSGDKTEKEKRLTHAEKIAVMEHLQGYDISPEMAKLARVNMYLHGAKTPNIAEYDTLSSDKNWDEYFDVILANPPFMTPKGGVMPHKKFSVQSNRAEVLFVDYIMNHLKPKGRAGIIVPEGIIFQSGKAYKELRKNLVNDGLFAVVSLPAGVFNPYSGVKTSILFFDNEVAKKTDQFLFVKVSNDGYDLGAQRREGGKNDLPDAGVVLKGFRAYIKNDEYKETIESFVSGSKNGFLVPKAKISETDDYNLSADRYKTVTDFSNSKYDRVALGDICEVYQPKTITSKEIKDSGPYKVFGANGLIGFYDQYNHEDSEIAITCRGATCGTVNFTEPKSWITGNAMVVKPKDERVDKMFLYYYLRNTDLSSVITGAAQPQITGAALKPFEIPIPPLEVQKEIVEQIKVKQKAIEGAKQVIENLERERRYFGQSLRKLENVEMVKLGEIIKLSSGKGLTQDKIVPGDYLVYGGNGVIGYHDSYFVENETIVIGRVGAYCGSIHITRPKSWITDNGLYVVDFLKKINLRFLAETLSSLNLNDYAKVGGQPSISQSIVYEKVIPIPSIEIQEEIVSKIEIQENIIESNKKLIEIMEKKIEEVLSEI